MIFFFIFRTNLSEFTRQFENSGKHLSDRGVTSPGSVGVKDPGPGIAIATGEVAEGADHVTGITRQLTLLIYSEDLNTGHLINRTIGIKN